MRNFWPHLFWFAFAILAAGCQVPPPSVQASTPRSASVWAPAGSTMAAVYAAAQSACRQNGADARQADRRDYNNGTLYTFDCVR